MPVPRTESCGEVKKSGSFAAPEREWMRMRLEVDCYAGRKADERPVRFRLEEHEYVVEEVLDQWYGPEDVSFKIRTDDGNLYILRHQTSQPDGSWELISFRQTGQR